MSDVGGREAADRVVVTGGTGLVGRRLVDDLRESGVAVTVLSRGAAGVLPTGVTRVAVAYDRGIDPELLADAGSLVHLAGAGVAEGRWTPARRRVIRDSRVESARALVRAIADLPQARRPRALVSASAVGIYGDRGDEILTEASDPGSGFLAEVCKEWEASVLAAGRLGVRVAVLRFGMVLARDGGALARLVPLFRLGLGGRVGSGRQWVSWIHVADLSRMIRWALAPSGPRGVVNAVAPGAVRNSEFTRCLARELRRPALLPAPAFALRVALGEMASVLLSSQRVVPEVAERGGFPFRYGNLSEALRDLISAESARRPREPRRG